MKKVYIENAKYEQLTVQMFKERGYSVVDNYTEADFICFTGGADVSPALYREVNTDSHCDVGRDLHCIGIFNYAKYYDVPCIGICRGGQFLNVMNGGKMIQDYPSQGYIHRMYHYSEDEETINSIKVTSTHHQVMIPPNEAHIYGWGKTKQEAEIVIYENGFSVYHICFQPHPEYEEAEGDCRDLFFQLIKECIEV